ncbi:MAG TPA: zinc dependent phospholipase C family protein [Candidatus Methanoperedens sp.]
MDYIRKSIALGITLTLLATIQPVAAWGDITHMVIISKLTPNEPDNGLIKTYPKYAKGGGIGPDIFYYSLSPIYSDWAHTQKTAQLPREMKVLAGSNAQQKAYVDGWWSHFASDITGHKYYVNKFDANLSNDVEAGVDANLAKEVSDYSFSVPYGMVQTAYKKVYGTAPSTTTILAALGTQQAAIYLERTAISWGLLNTQKMTYNTFWDVYSQSISDSVSAINTNPIQDYDLSTGLPIPAMAVYSSTLSERAARPDKDIIDAANDLLKSGAVEVVIEDDKVNQVFHVKEPSLKDKNKFDKALEKLAKKKKGREQTSKPFV